MQFTIVSLRNSQGHSAPALAPASHHTAGSLCGNECAYSSCSSSLRSAIGQSIAGTGNDVNSAKRRNCNRIVAFQLLTRHCFSPTLTSTRQPVTWQFCAFLPIAFATAGRKTIGKDDKAPRCHRLKQPSIEETDEINLVTTRAQRDHPRGRLDSAA